MMRLERSHRNRIHESENEENTISIPTMGNHGVVPLGPPKRYVKSKARAYTIYTIYKAGRYALCWLLGCLTPSALLYAVAFVERNLVQQLGSSGIYHVRVGLAINAVLCRYRHVADDHGGHTSYFGYALQHFVFHGLGMSHQD
jgi:hypothetical protein